MSKPAKRRSNRYVSRAERRMIRRTAHKFPALGSAIKTLLNIHSLEARAVRTTSGAPYNWIVEKAGPHKTGGPWKKPVFEMSLKSDLEEWQFRCSNPDTWNGMNYFGRDFGTMYTGRWPTASQLKIYQEMASQISRGGLAIHDEVISEAIIYDDLEATEARIIAYARQAAAPEPAIDSRALREKMRP